MPDSYYENKIVMLPLDDKALEIETKICIKCKVEKPIHQFNNDRGYKHPTCKCCLKKAKIVLRKIKKTLPPSPKVCECCGEPPKPGQELMVDHDHETGKYRGRICERCNHGFGKFGDNREGILKALKYLDMTEERQKNINYLDLFEVNS